MQKSPFDNIAPFYDELFSDTKIGMYLKQIVWKYLDENLSEDLSCNGTTPNKKLWAGVKPLNILEINCGTGIDAIYLAKKGHNVIATDQSAGMIKTAQQKLKDVGSVNVIFQQMDIREIKNNFFDQQFDIIFSNFGGLNCIDKNDIKKFGKDVKDILKPNGRIIATIMPPLSIWDFLYFLFIVDPLKGIKRLLSKPITAFIYESEVTVNYFSPHSFSKLLGDDFQIKKILPVGFFLPPTYLDNYFKKHSSVLKRLNKLENLISKKSFLSNLSNHYLIELQLKK
ncbi:MAG: class I SAM-dependent methyltransferase [Bacteroidetes bacterium]|nr:class I SAM-dependent methyltransferase [Bacteroidota bacterium]